MKEKEIYLAGGCYWGVEKYVSNIKGVLRTTVGFANGNTIHPTYEQVRYENTGHAETVRVVYDAEEYHQKYLDKNPNGYCHVPFAEIQWVKTIEPMAEIK